MSLRSYVPINKNNLPERFEFPFGDEIFVIGIDFNKSQGYFTADLFEADMTPIVIGEKIVAKKALWSDLTDPRLPSESLVPMDESRPDSEITFENFGETVQLYIDNLPPSGLGGT